MQFEDSFYFHCHSSRERGGPDGTASGDAVVCAEDLLHKLAEAVNDRGLVNELGSAAYQAKSFHEPLDVVEIAELGSQGGDHS